MKKPSVLIELHITGRGTGYELDDLLSGGMLDEETKAIILSIHEKYRSEEFPIGTSNPASYDKLGQLAKDLADKGQ